MTDDLSSTSFSYDYTRLESCATVDDKNEICWGLYQDYCRHYHHRSITNNKNDDDPRSRFHRFQETVQYVHQHNNGLQEQQDESTSMPTFRLTLNQFADQDPVPQNQNQNNATSNKSDWQEEWYQSWEEEDDEDTATTKPLHDQIRLLQQQKQDIPLTRLSSSDSILQWAMQQHIYYPKPTKTKKKKGVDATTTRDSPKNIKIPAHAHKNIDSPFATVDLPESAEGVELDVLSKRHYQKNPHDRFAKSLSWATTQNPDGLVLVRDSFDQKRCGSCWAFAATGTVETSAARRAAQEEYWKVKNSSSRSPSHAKRRARKVEADTFRSANLSIQELIDCDTAADQGCTGGNPLLAFFYIHRYGLVPWEEYPYTGQEGACQLDRIFNPIANVQSWGVLPKNHEDMIELALRYIGPVAVGVNGADPAFVAYEGGIFDKAYCDQGANHAMLIVGYDQKDILVNGRIETIRYWIARNSWGAGWGEGGYVRVKRGPGGKKIPGVCGIARNPSVALGGQIRWDREPLVDRKRDPTTQDNREYSESTSRADKWPVCHQIDPVGTLVYGGCQEMAKFVHEHKAFSMGMIAIVCALVVAVWPLSLQYRRRRRRKRRRRMSPNSAILSTGINSDASLVSSGSRSPSRGGMDARSADETTPMLVPHVGYGSGGGTI